MINYTLTSALTWALTSTLTSAFTSSLTSFLTSSLTSNLTSMDSGQKLHPFSQPSSDWSTVDLTPVNQVPASRWDLLSWMFNRFDWSTTELIVMYVCLCVSLCVCLMDSGQKLHPFSQPSPDWSTVDLFPPWQTILVQLRELHLQVTVNGNETNT